MTVFYKGVGVGTHWHDNDASDLGFVPKAPEVIPSKDRLIQHIARANVASPYVSLTSSYGVAYAYATPTEDTPGYVYEIELTAPMPRGVKLVDPIREIATDAPALPTHPPYGHDGDQKFLLGVLNREMKELLLRNIIQPFPGVGVPRPANLSLELETLAYVLRDAEILVIGNIPAACILNRYEAWGESDEA